VVRGEGRLPLTPDPSPLEGERGAGCGFRAKSRLFPLSPLRGEGMGVRGQRTLASPRQRLRGSADPVSLWTIRGACGRGVLPLTPDPSPLKGRGELDADCGRKADAFTPLPFEGRGDGGEGSKNPGSASSTPPGQCGSSVVVEYPWCVWEGRFTPHPRPLSPGRGEGSQMRVQGEKQTLSPLSPSRGEGNSALFTTIKTQQSPLAPTGGEGSGVRGNTPFTCSGLHGQPTDRLIHSVSRPARH
jgi:hypothetical protein